MSSVPDAVASPNLAGDIVRALVLYALAEVQGGHASTLRVSVDDTGFSVADDGRGHAVDRQIDGHPYLDLVYRHLDFPFGREQAPAVQLQGIGLSLVNRLCSELTVSVAKPGAVHRLVFRDGALHERTQVDVDNGLRGNTIAGRLRPGLQAAPLALDGLERWLQALQATSPRLQLVFNGHDLDARPPCP